MKMELTIEPKDILAVKDVIDRQSKHPAFDERIQNNVSGVPLSINEELLWRTQIMCLLTTQQKSSENSLVTKFLKRQPFPLSLEECRNSNDLHRFVRSVLSSTGNHYPEKNSGFAVENFKKLEGGGWSAMKSFADKLMTQRSMSPDPSHRYLEREAANYMRENYSGFGPKQSRNFWQDMGLSRYEFVLDSRFAKWLKELGSPFPISSACLNDESYYVFLSEALLKLCIEANVLPCILDVAVFKSMEKQVK